MERGVIIDADIEEPMYLSFSHSKEVVEKTIGAYQKACGAASAITTMCAGKTSNRFTGII